MDLVSPLVHEFTYQAMAHDLLPIKEGDKLTFHMKINEGTPLEEEKDMELTDKDKVWVENRHRHMKDTIDKLMNDFQTFIQQNPNFTDQNQDTTSLNAIKDMLAGLPQFQEMKEAYSLHLTMAQESMNLFQRNKLPDIASVEQTLATGLDEDFKKPKNILDQVVRLLDDPAVTPSDRLRLIAVYVLYRNGLISDDIKRLLAHSSLPPQEADKITNLDLLGAHTTRPDLKTDQPPPPPPLFPRNNAAKNLAHDEEYSLSRFEPAVKHMLEDVCRGALDPTVFPYTVPPPDGADDPLASQGSLRSAAPRWASANRRQVENRQRVIVFVAGGATYSEARACYEVGDKLNRDVFLATSHMLTPQLFLRQVADLSADRRRLDLPADRPPPKAPAHLFERPAPPPPLQPVTGPPGGGGQRRPVGPPGSVPVAAGGGGVRPPTKGLAAMTLNSGASSSGGGVGGDQHSVGSGSGGKLVKEKEEKKKRRLFGLKK